MDISKSELQALVKVNHDFFMNLPSTKYVIVNELWQILQLEDKLKIAFHDCEFKRENISSTYQIFGTIDLDGKIIAHYDNSIGIGGSVTLKTFCDKKGERADKLIQTNAIKLVEGYHRILDWHSIYKNGYVQNLAKNQWVLRFKPETPTMEQLEELLKRCMMSFRLKL